MAFSDAMPDIEAIQAENERVIAATHEAETKKENMDVLKAQMQSEIEMMPWRIGVGGITAIFLVYWFLIRR